MRPDYIIAFLLFAAALTSAMTLMVAPGYLGFSKKNERSIFWAGSVLTGALVASALYFALRGENENGLPDVRLIEPQTSSDKYTVNPPQIPMPSPNLPQPKVPLPEPKVPPGVDPQKIK
jgi:hypothetical protein